MSRAPKSPSLPQNTSPEQQQSRQEELAVAQSEYTWTTEVPSLPGVPLAAKVPKQDDPTMAWLFTVIDVAVKVVENAVAVKLAHGDDASRGASAAQSRIAGISSSVSSVHGKATHSKTGNFLEKIAEAIGVAANHEERLLGHLKELKEIADTHRLSEGEATSLESYEALFNTLPLPRIASSFMEDDTFAMLRVAGPNPTLLRNITAMPANFPVSNDQFQQTMGGADSLDGALADGRVFLLDYVELEALEPGSWQGLPQFPYVPLVLLAVPIDGDSLHAIAIQCGQDSSSNPVFTPSSDGPGEWGWQRARTVVEVADGNYHELFVHLARTHLVQEAFVMATRRQLPHEHPLNALLQPHIEGTLFINNSAAGDLIAKGGPIDSIFAGTIESTQLAAVADRLGFDFYERMLPKELANRGVGTDSKLVDYPYRDDGLLVWEAIADWVNQYVGIYYENDGDVTADNELAAWVQDVIEHGSMKGFRAIDSRDQLVDVLTMVIWNGSAQHAAVNFPQATYMSYAPALSGAGWSAAPTAQAGSSKGDWLNMMPPLSLAAEQLDVLSLLGGVYYRMLGDYRSNELPYREWFTDPKVVDNALPRFQAALVEVEALIDARNGERRWEYSFLKPSRIPNSINI